MKFTPPRLLFIIAKSIIAMSFCYPFLTYATTAAQLLQCQTNRTTCVNSCAQNQSCIDACNTWKYQNCLSSQPQLPGQPPQQTGGWFDD